MAGKVCTDMHITEVTGDDSKMMCRWHCPASHIDHFDLGWEYQALNSAKWIPGGSSSIKPVRTGTWFQYVFSLPRAQSCSGVRFHATPVATRDKTEYYWENGTKKSRTVAWWTGSRAYSEPFASTLWEAAIGKLVAARALAEKTWAAAEAAKEDCDKKRKAASWKAAVAADQTVQKRASECSKACADAIEAHDSSGTSWPADRANFVRWKASCDSWAVTYKDYEASDKEKMTAAEKKAQMDGQVGNAKTCLANAKKHVDAAATYRNQGKVGSSASSEDKASAEYESAAYWYGLAASNAGTDAKRKEYQDAQSAARTGASAAKSRADADRAKVIEVGNRPDPPTAQVSQAEDAAGNPLMSILMDINCTSKWTDRIIIYRDADGAGAWPVWKTITRQVPKAGGAWSTQRVYDGTVQAGHSYRYYFRSGVGESNTSDRTDVFGPFSMRPSQPRNLAAKLAGDGAVTLTWENTGTAPAEKIEVQYSSFFTTANAWNLNAQGEIQTMDVAGNAQSATVTGLDKGKTWYFRVKRISAGGSAWATIAGGEAKGYLTCSCKVPSEPTRKLARPTGLKAEKASDTSIKLTWTDSCEEGCRYEIEHSTNGNAWADNAVGDIETETYSNPGGQYASKSFAYTVTRLEQGRKHFLRVVKRDSDGAQAIAQPATHESRASDYTVFCMLPAAAADLSTPASLKAAKATDNSIRLTWTDTQAAGQSYEVWYTDSATAFADNAMGDISTASYDELTSSRSKVYTLTSLERGRTWFAKVRKTSQDGAGPWSAVASCKLAAEALGKPTGLKAAQASGDSITLTWTDALEDGASCTVLHTTNERAFALNAQGDIDETAVSGAEASPTARTYTYTATGLEKGAKHLFRLKKDKGAPSVLAAAASGATRLDASTCFLALPEEVLPSLAKPTSVAVEKRGDDSLRLSWRATKAEGDAYEIHHTADAEAFELGDMGAITSVAVTSENASSHSHTISGLERGRTYWLRVRTTNDGRVSEWSSTVELELPAELEATEELYAPTVADSLQAYPLDGGMVPLSWTHNSSQASDQSAYEIEVTVTKAGGQVVPRAVSGQTASSYGIDPSDWGLDDGAEVAWRVRTCGAIADAWSPWSRLQSFRTFAPPVAGLALAGGDGSHVGPGEPLTSMPLNVTVAAANGNGDPLDTGNAPIAYALRIVAVEGYEGEGRDGQRRYVAAGEEVYSASLTANDEGFDPAGWELSIPARELALAGGELYEALADVVTSQGLKGSAASGAFEAQWDGELPQPTASIVFDGDSYTCRITPLVNLPEEEAQGEGGGEEDIDTDLTPEEEAAMADWGVDTVVPDTDPSLDFEPVEDPSVDAGGAPLRPGTTLDVYRIDADGSAVEVASGMANDGQSRAMDPHPSFGTCTYRIVAHDEATGLQSACDFEVETKVPRIVIQWDETWDESDQGGQPLYGGSMLELAYNTQAGESYAIDSVLRDYAGRSHPVAYYGTQRGQSASMGAELIRELQGEQLALARRLAAWPGDCYVREPSGTGYWASVQVSISHAHGSAAVPVSLEVRRVDHGG